jgi:hypothetical protein
MAKGTVQLNGKVSLEEFITRAIKKLRTEESKGIHTVYSGLVDAARDYFGKPKDADYVKDWFWTSLEALVALGKFETVVRKGGKMVYLPGEAPKTFGKKDNSRLIADILA